jgi:hypothetical protein
LQFDRFPHFFSQASHHFSPIASLHHFVNRSIHLSANMGGKERFKLCAGIIFIYGLRRELFTTPAKSLN